MTSSLRVGEGMVDIPRKEAAGHRGRRCDGSFLKHRSQRLVQPTSSPLYLVHLRTLALSSPSTSLICPIPVSTASPFV